MRNREKKIILLVLLGLLVLGGCRANDSAHSEYTTDQAGYSFNAESDKQGFAFSDEDGSPVNGTALGNLAAGSIESKIIRSAEMELEVKDLDNVLAKITALIDLNHGFIETSSRRVYSEMSRVYITLRIPADVFNGVYQELQQLGTVTTDNVSTQDVTEEYIDLDARLTTLETKQESFILLLAKADTIEDILKVENELDRVVYEIERIKGRMQYLNRQVDMSTINLNIIEKNPVSTVDTNYLERFKFAISDGWGSMVNFIMNFLLAAVWLLPFLPILIIVLLLLRKLWQKIRSKRTKATELVD